MIKRVLRSLIVASLAWLCLWPAVAAAASVPSGVTLSPAIEQLTLNTSQSDYSFTAYAANNTSHNLTVQLSSLDFSPSNDSGGIAFAGSKASNLNNTHGLASWISFSPDKFTLAPGSSQAFKVNLIGTNSLVAGGHYAAVILQVINDNGLPVTNRVSFNQEVSMLLFTSTNGSGTRDIKLSTSSAGIAWFHMPQIINLFLADSGNTQLTPRGYLTIFSGSAKPISRSILNPGSALVLPGSTRLLETPTNAVKKPFWPGVYHLQVAYNYDGATKLSYYNTNFVYVGTPFVVIVLAVVVLLISGRLAWLYQHRKYRIKH